MNGSVNSFREILLRKSRFDDDLYTLIKHMDESKLIDYMYESLEKMAGDSNTHKNLKTGANAKTYMA